MARTKLRSAALAAGSPDDVEVAFYEALRAADLDRLMACWADEDEVWCIHPGSARLLGLAAIRAAYEEMLAHRGLELRLEGVRKTESLGCSVHSLQEHLVVQTSQGPQEIVVLATNVYLKTAQGWRMVVHHASLGSSDDAQLSPSPAAQMLH